MTSTMFYSALRASEASQTHVEHITFNIDSDGNAELLIPRSKSDQAGKGHVQPLPAMAASRVKAWLQEEGISHGLVFRTLQRTGFYRYRLTDRAIGRESVRLVIRKRAKLVGLTGITSHSPRRSCAAHLSARGWSSHLIMEYGRRMTSWIVLLYTRNQRIMPSKAFQTFARQKRRRIRLAG